MRVTLPLLLALLALGLAPPPAAAEEGIRVSWLYDARQEPPLLGATLVPTGAWPSPVEWPLPSGTLLGVVDEKGSSLASEVAPGGILRFEPGEAREARVRMAVDPLVPRGNGFREGSFTAQGEVYEVVPPEGLLALDRAPLPHARVVFGPASHPLPSPPVEPGPDLVKTLDASAGGATVTLWWNASKRSLAPGDDAGPKGWRETTREDLWGPLAPGAQPWPATTRPSMLRLSLVPDVGPDALPLVGIGVQAAPGVRAFARLDLPEGAFASRTPRGEEVRAVDVAMPTQAVGWTRAEGGPFVVHARDPEDAAFVARAGERAGPVLRRVLDDAGLPTRERIPVVLSPSGESGWARWGFVQPESFVRELRTSGRTWDEAAILVHEGFHGGQLDAAPWLDLAWWAEGTAGETDRYLPAEAYCRGEDPGDCHRPPALEGPALARFERERFPFEWRALDPTLTPDEVAYRYAASRHLAASYRDRAGEGAWRAVWSDLASRPGCCDHAALLDVLTRAAPHLAAEEIERPPPPNATSPSPAGEEKAPTTGDARTPAPTLAVLLVTLVLAARAARRGRR